MSRRLVTRRRFLAAAGGGVLGSIAGQRAVPAAAAEDRATTPAEAFRLLIEGNNRFVAGQPTVAARASAHRVDLARGARPFAAVLTCADSRLAPEIVFDQGLGALVVVRTAGNVADAAAVGSLEFAVETFHLPLIIVLGHEGCDAIQWAIDMLRAGTAPPGQLGAVLDALRPAVQLARLRAQLAALRIPPDPEGDLLEETMRAHVGMVVERLRRAEPVFAPRLQRDRLRIVGLRYALATGGVEIVA
ncbi:MAG: carbonic anhydrase [Dehalococcoidia bacterium]|nr:carbonic anhydrase [Dehalococcoidia bacterium]